MSRPGERPRPGVAAPDAPEARRRDIDALRAVAVAAVVAYHVFPALLPGGFVGVDIFFVISGYLITRHLLRETARGPLDFLAFYGRRIRRIFPALIVLLAGVLVAGWALLPAHDYRQLGKHVAAASGFSSNFVLMAESGYFDEAATTKPLLHLWSLAVEEQFYLAWPVLVFVALRARLPALALVGAAALLSFAFCRAELGPHPVAAFYLSLARAWELMAGAGLAAFELARAGGRMTSMRAAALGNAGWLAILASFALIDDLVPFPGPWALLPVLGATAVLACPGSGIGRVLAARRGVVWLGLVSYPLYLWHWPVLTLARMASGGALDLPESVAAVALSVGLAAATWAGVERPCQSSPRRRATAQALVVALLWVGIAGAGVWRDEGVPGRGAVAQAEAAQARQRAQDDAPMPYRRCGGAMDGLEPTLDFCNVSRDAAPAYAIIGDSHAQKLFVGLAARDARESWLLVGHDSTPPLLGVDLYQNGRGESSRARATKAIDYVSGLASVRVVVLAFFGNAYLQRDAFAADHKRPFAFDPAALTMSSPGSAETSRHALMRAGLDRTIRQLQAAGKKVVVLVDDPELPFLPRECLRRPGTHWLVHSCELARATSDARRADLVQLTREVVADSPGARMLDAGEFLCDAAQCRFDSPAGPLYEDSNHLGPLGAALVAAPLRALVRSLDDEAAHGP